MKNSQYDQLFVPTYKRGGEPFVSGKGVWLFNTAKKKYLDFGSGIAVSALGHSHPALVKTLTEQGKKVLHTSNLYFSQTQIDLAKLLIKKSFGDKIFFCNSGTEANEAAIKFARKWAFEISPEKYHVLSFDQGFHGRTYGALSATAQKKFQAGFGPMLAGFHYSPLNDIEAAKKVLDSKEVAAIIVEPLQGESGVNAAQKEFLTFLRSYANEKKIVLIFDEIQCGMGRTGTLWNYEQTGVVPDIMTLAKPIGGGLPLGVAVCKDFVASALKPGDHGTTFGGNLLACAMGTTLLSIVSQKSFLAQVKKQGAYLIKELSTLKKNNPAIVDIRGAGLLIGVQLASDPLPVVAGCKEKGLLLVKAENNTVRFLPPLIVTQKEIALAVKIFADVLKQ